MSNDAVQSDDSFVHSTLTNGGASRHASTGAAPPASGYMVGGATNSEGQAYREHALKINQFHGQAVAAHAQAIQGHFGDAVSSDSIYQGSWREKRNKVVMDASNHLENKQAALHLARTRGERAVYDLSKGKDIPTAGAHKAGDHKGSMMNLGSGDGGEHAAVGGHTAGSHKGAYSLANDISRRPLAGAHRYVGEHAAGSHKA